MSSIDIWEIGSDSADVYAISYNVIIKDLFSYVMFSQYVR